MNGPRVLTLSCGHERWAPSDWEPGNMVPCAECGDPDQKMRYRDALKASPHRTVTFVRGDR